MRKLLIFLILVFFYAIPASGETVKIETLLDQMISAYGGEENLKKLNTYRQEWSLTAAMSGEKGFDSRSVALPDRLRVELVYFAHNEIRILNGDGGLKIYNRTQKKKVQSPGLDAMKLQRMRLYHPLTLKERLHNSSLTQKEGFHVIILSEKELITEYYINPSTFMIEKVVGLIQAGGMSMEFKTLYSDFRKVDGVVLPHKEVKFAGATNTAVLTLKKIELLKMHDVKLFELK
ncbi:MAG: hypothetical protein IMF07_01595 [Proteobacteria bacterium]|nr:hypothetical protein [Pseudomonadota bacterium]